MLGCLTQCAGALMNWRAVLGEPLSAGTVSSTPAQDKAVTDQRWMDESEASVNLAPSVSSLLCKWISSSLLREKKCTNCGISGAYVREAYQQCDGHELQISRRLSNMIHNLHNCMDSNLYFFI